MPYGAAYNSSKFAVRALSKVAALEWAKSGIRVNTLCPGPTMTKDVDLSQKTNNLIEQKECGKISATLFLYKEIISNQETDNLL